MGSAAMIIQFNLVYGTMRRVTDEWVHHFDHKEDFASIFAQDFAHTTWDFLPLITSIASTVVFHHVGLSPVYKFVVNLTDRYIAGPAELIVTDMVIDSISHRFSVNSFSSMHFGSISSNFGLSPRSLDDRLSQTSENGDDPNSQESSSAPPSLMMIGRTLSGFDDITSHRVTTSTHSLPSIIEEGMIYTARSFPPSLGQVAHMVPGFNEISATSTGRSSMPSLPSIIEDNDITNNSENSVNSIAIRLLHTVSNAAGHIFDYIGMHNLHAEPALPGVTIESSTSNQQHIDDLF
jgi:hypothetical protein